MIQLLKSIWQLQAAALLCGCVLDWLFGDPYWLPHLVRAMGRMIGWLEKKLRQWMGEEKSREAGQCLVGLMVLFWTAVPALVFGGLFFIGGKSGLWLLFLGEVLVCYQLMAARGLYGESMKVCRSLEAGRREEARRNVSMIVGRDTAVLDEAGIARAAVETVAENTSDGVVAPFLFMAVLGPVGGTLYKAVNTMDSMVGYKNDRYLWFGRAAAKLDDVFNFLPARLTGLLMVLSAWILPGTDGREAWRIFLRDRKKHASPNSAHGEAACAGALHLRLAGDAWYFGTLHKKPYIGDESRPILPSDIRRAGCLMFLSQGILMAGLLLILYMTR